MSGSPDKIKTSGATNSRTRPQAVFVQCQDVDLESEVDVFFAFFVLRGRFWSVHRRFNLDLPDVAPQADRYRSHIILSEYKRSSKASNRLLKRFSVSARIPGWCQMASALS